jgi:hypothetical protein
MIACDFTIVKNTKSKFRIVTNDGYKRSRYAAMMLHAVKAKSEFGVKGPISKLALRLEPPFRTLEPRSEFEVFSTRDPRRALIRGGGEAGAKCALGLAGDIDEPVFFSLRFVTSIKL